MPNPTLPMTTAAWAAAPNKQLDVSDRAVLPEGGGEYVRLADALADMRGDGQRSLMEYLSASSIRIRERVAVMNGFRFHGRGTRRRGPVYPFASYPLSASWPGDLGASASAVTLESWYALFAVANAGDAAATLKLMPFIRARTVPGLGVVTFNKGGENIHSAIAQTYSWLTSALVGADVLVITESSPRVNGWSGRLTTVTANTNAQMTLQDAGTIGALDWLLVAPPGYAHYRYMGSVYVDTAELRNLADDGRLVGSRGVDVTDPNFPTAGAIVAYAEVDFGGYVPPLATGVIVNFVASLSTASLGSFAQYLSHDSSSHDIAEQYRDKEGTATLTLSDYYQCAFSFGQQLYALTAGSLAASRANGKLQIRGWVEP